MHPLTPPFSYAQIDTLLLAVAHELPRRPDWYTDVARLSRSATAETRLPVYQAVRDDGCLPEDAGFFLVSYATEDLALATARRIERDCESREQLEPDVGHPDESWEERLLRLEEPSLKRDMLTNFAAYGESEMGDLLECYADEFQHRYEKGRGFFFDPPEPGAAELRCAVQELSDHVRQCVGSRAPLGPLACRWSIDYGFVDLQVFPTPIELVGGPQDGAVIDPDLDFDLLRILDAFDRIDGIGWTLDGEDREYHYVCFRGAYRGHDVWVTVFAGAPAGEKPTVKSDELRKWRAFRGGSMA